MILKQIKAYVQSHPQVSLNDIAIHFDANPDAVRGMLDFWVRKGKIKHYSSENVCAGGCSCGQKNSNDLYEWNQQIANISIEIK